VFCQAGIWVGHGIRLQGRFGDGKLTRIQKFLNQQRRGSETNEVFTDYQPQYPDLQAHLNAVFSGLQEVFTTIRQLPDLTPHLPVAYSVIEEIVEGFVEGFLTRFYEC
jgi:hypothetical protein